MMLLLLLLLHCAILAAGHGGNIKAYGINTLLEPKEGMTWLQREVSFPKDTTEVTVCFFFMLQYQDEDQTVLLMLTREHTVTVSGRSLEVQAGNHEVRSTATLVFWRWSHTCVILGPRPTIYVDGDLTTSSQDNKENPIQPETSYIMTVGLPPGVFDLSFRSPFGGKVTQPLVIPRRLPGDQIHAMATCSSTPEGDLVEDGWLYLRCIMNDDNGCADGDYWKLRNVTSIQKASDRGMKKVVSEGQQEVPEVISCEKGPQRIYSEKEPEEKPLWHHSVQCTEVLESREVCLPRPTFRSFLQAGHFTYEQAESTCNKHGGHLPHLDQHTISALLMKGGEGAWQYLEPWLAASSPGKCNLLVHGSNTKPTSCNFSAHHLLCQLAWDRTFELHYNEESVGHLHLIDDGSTVQFISEDGRLMVDHESLVVKDWRATFRGQMGLGRYTLWQEKRKYMNVTLSTCAKGEFTCGDGTCINLSHRCDGKNDCGVKDYSDETYCGLLQSLSQSYRADHPPLTRTPLAITVRLVKVHDVNVQNHLLQTWLKVVTRWRDERVTLTHLSQHSWDNIIKDRELLWSPVYHLPNAKFQDDVMYRKGENVRSDIFAHVVGRGQFGSFKGYEGYEYNGSTSAYLEKEEHFLINYLCEFELGLFPFDMHQCFMYISIVNRGTFKAFFNISEMRSESYETYLSLFHVSEMKCEYRPDQHGGPSSFRLKVLLTRRCGAFILTTFLPSMILGLIAVFTHSFEEDNFSDRIMVALSCLIVIASLFSSTSSSSPNSASPKAVDIFFFFYITRLFMIFLSHSIHGMIFRCRKLFEEEAAVAAATAVVPLFRSKNGKGPQQLPRRLSSKVMAAWMDDCEKNSVKRRSRNWPRTVDLLSLILGLTIDVIFLTVFVYYIIEAQANKKNSFMIVSDTNYTEC